VRAITGEAATAALPKPRCERTRGTFSPASHLCPHAPHRRAPAILSRGSNAVALPRRALYIGRPACYHRLAGALSGGETLKAAKDIGLRMRQTPRESDGLPEKKKQSRIPRVKCRLYGELTDGRKAFKACGAASASHCCISPHQPSFAVDAPPPRRRIAA